MGLKIGFVNMDVGKRDNGKVCILTLMNKQRKKEDESVNLYDKV